MKNVITLWTSQRANGYRQTPVWLVVAIESGEVINWAVDKADAQKLITSQQQHAYLCRLLPPAVEFNVP